MSVVPDSEKLTLSAREMAVMLGISERLLWAETKAGNIPHIRIGARVLYPLKEIKAWLEFQIQKR